MQEKRSFVITQEAFAKAIGIKGKITYIQSRRIVGPDGRNTEDTEIDVIALIDVKE